MFICCLSYVYTASVLCTKCVCYRNVAFLLSVILKIPGVVVGARAQDVAQRVPGQTPDHPFMSHFHPANFLLHPDTKYNNEIGTGKPVTVQHTKPLQIQHHYPACQKSREPSEPPLANRPSWTGCHATAEDKRTQCNPEAFHFQDSECVQYQLLTCRLLLVPSEHLQLLFQVPDVKEFAQVVTWCRQQPVAIQVPLHLHHCVLVGVAEQTQQKPQLTETRTRVHTGTNQYGKYVK